MQVYTRIFIHERHSEAYSFTPISTVVPKSLCMYKVWILQGMENSPTVTKSFLCVVLKLTSDPEFLKLTFGRKWITPCEMPLKTVSENDVNEHFFLWIDM